MTRDKPIDDSNLDPRDNMEEFQPLSPADMAYYAQMRDWREQRPDCAATLVIPGAGFGDIAMVPAPFLKHPKGIRDIEEWDISTAIRKDYVLEVFEHQCRIAEQLKQQYGRDIVFWGGGVDTQKTIAFGTPDQVYQQVLRRIEIFNQGGGLVFNAIHNIQANTPTDNMLAMLKAIEESSK